MLAQCRQRLETRMNISKSCEHQKFLNAVSHVRGRNGGRMGVRDLQVLTIVFCSVADLTRHVRAGMLDA